MKRKIIYSAVVSVLLGLLVVSNLSTLALAQPGTASDPLVTQRYVDDRIAELQAQIDALQGQTGQSPGRSLSLDERDAIIADVLDAVLFNNQVVPFSAVFIPRGNTLTAEAGTEIILRSGAATVVAGPNGLVDVTAGRDVGNRQSVSRNHLLLVPASDGRGLHITADAWLMIKGGFTLG